MLFHTGIKMRDGNTFPCSTRDGGNTSYWMALVIPHDSCVGRCVSGEMCLHFIMGWTGSSPSTGCRVRFTLPLVDPVSQGRGLSLSSIQYSSTYLNPVRHCWEVLLCIPSCTDFVLMLLQFFLLSEERRSRRLGVPVSLPLRECHRNTKTNSFQPLMFSSFHRSTY